MGGRFKREGIYVYIIELVLRLYSTNTAWQSNYTLNNFFFLIKVFGLLGHGHVNCLLAFRTISGSSSILLCTTGSLAL